MCLCATCCAAQRPVQPAVQYRSHFCQKGFGCIQEISMVSNAKRQLRFALTMIAKYSAIGNRERQSALRHWQVVVDRQVGEGPQQCEEMRALQQPDHVAGGLAFLA